MTTSRLSSSTLQQLTPLLGSLARMAATGSRLGDHELNLLLLGADLDAEPMVLGELKRWGRILMAFKEQPSVEFRRATVEALSLRGLPEALVLLAVDTVANSSLAPTAVGKLKVTPERLDFGLLPSGKGVSAELEVEGGPGRIVAESDQVRVSHTRFGDGTTRVRVEVPPLTHGLLWTSVKLVTADETVEVPLLAQWEEVLVRDDTVPTTIEVPDLAGQKLSQARNKLAGVGLKLGGQNEAPDNAVSVGRISEQEPRAGMKAKRGSSVSVTVSTGPSRRSKKKKPLERVRVPNLVGQNASVANGMLEDAGLRYDGRSNVPEWASIEPAGGERHLPVYLLVDTSWSMEGAPIQSVHLGLKLFQREVSGESFARDIVKVGIITFASEAELVTGGLVPISDFEPPDLTAAGVRRLDLAFEKLIESMERDVIRAVKGEGGQKGDWKPMVFVLTAGRPTDENGNETDRLWQAARDTLIDCSKGQVKPCAIVAVGCSPGVDDDTLKAIAYTQPTRENSDLPTHAFRIGSNEAAFVALFEFLSQN